MERGRGAFSLRLFLRILDGRCRGRGQTVSVSYGAGKRVEVCDSASSVRSAFIREAHVLVVCPFLYDQHVAKRGGPK